MKIITGRSKRPDRILVTGVEGVGKTTFAAHAPGAVFICSEDGLGSLDVARFQSPKTFQDVIDNVVDLRKESPGFKTLVVDSLDWLEPLVWKATCEKYKWESIEAPGYGKGYVAANDLWRQLQMEFDRLREDTDMQVILIAHTQIKTFNNPMGADYSRFEPALARQATALWTQWADTVLFACFEEYTKKDGNKAKAQSTGKRIAHTVRSSGWTAKTRWTIPPVIELNWYDYEGFRDEVTPLDELAVRVKELINDIKDPELQEKAVAFYIENKGSEKKLLAMLARLRAVAEEQGSTTKQEG